MKESKIKTIIREEFVNTILHEKRILNHQRLIQVFSPEISEFITDAKQDVLQKIKDGDFDHDVNNFYNAINKSSRKEMLSDYTKSELSKMKLFKVDGYDIGFALKRRDDGKYSEIVSVFNNEPDIKGIGQELVKSAIKNGGCYLDHFDGFLSDLYSSLGFIEYAREPFNAEYDTDKSFRKKYGTPDIIYRKYKNCK